MATNSESGDENVENVSQNNLDLENSESEVDGIDTIDEDPVIVLKETGETMKQSEVLQALEYMRKMTQPSSSSSQLEIPNHPKFSCIVIVDAGFGCVKLAVAGAKIGVGFLCAIKNAHSQFPKAELESLMKDAPPGTWACATQTIDNVPLIATAYKYNKRKVLFFCWPVGAASVVPGQPYIAKWEDDLKRACSKEVARPVGISRFFELSNWIDIMNQLRQDVLGLEMKWVTKNCWFRLFTSLFGMTVTDCYQTYKSELVETNRNKNIKMLDFANLLAGQLVNNPFLADSQDTTNTHDDVKPEDEGSKNAHTLIAYADAGFPPNRQRWCPHCGNKTSFFCVSCGADFPVCRERTGRNCRSVHILKQNEVDFCTVQRRKRKAPKNKNNNSANV